MPKIKYRMLYKGVGIKTSKRKSGVYETRFVEFTVSNSIPKAKDFIIKDFKKRHIKFSHGEDCGICRILD